MSSNGAIMFLDCSRLPLLMAAATLVRPRRPAEKDKAGDGNNVQARGPLTPRAFAQTCDRPTRSPARCDKSRRPIRLAQSLPTNSRTSPNVQGFGGALVVGLPRKKKDGCGSADLAVARPEATVVCLGQLWSER